MFVFVSHMFALYYVCFCKLYLRCNGELLHHSFVTDSK